MRITCPKCRGTGIGYTFKTALAHALLHEECWRCHGKGRIGANPKKRKAKK